MQVCLLRNAARLWAVVQTLVRQAPVPVRQLESTAFPVQRPHAFVVGVLVPLAPTLRVVSHFRLIQV